MKGTALIYQPGLPSPAIVQLDAPLPIKFLHDLVGGYIEVVPGFDHIRVGDKIECCVAFCNEDGKGRLGLPFNPAATEEWEQAVPTGLRTPRGQWLDFLVGPVVVVFGDDEFMAEL